MELAKNENLFKNLDKINDKKFEVGQVVYYVRYSPYFSGGSPISMLRMVHFGVVEEIYSDGYVLANYETVDTRMIDGIPIADYEFNGKRKKLPKGWSYDTKLFEETNDPKWDKIIDEIKVKGKKCMESDYLKHLIDIGYLVRPSTQDLGVPVGTDINKQGWTIVKNTYQHQRYEPDYVTVPYQILYGTYEEAKKELDDYLAELNRQAELTDYDWVVEELEHLLDRYHNVFNHSEEECAAIRKFIMKQDVENLELRIISKGFQWKLAKNKKWITVEV